MGIGDRKQRERAHRRRTIMAAAARRLLSTGVESTTMADIAEEAELSKAALYLYFRSKEALIYALLHSILGEFRDRIVGAADGADGAAAKIQAMRSGYVSVYNEYSDYLQLFQYLDYRTHGAPEDASGAWDCFHVIDEIKEALVRVLEQGQRDGSIRPGFDPRRTAEMQVHMVESFLQRVAARDRFIRERSAFSPEELVEQMFDMIEYYLTTQP
ncbi:MAG: TetR/AcrR family transcriptional regulator [Spirochaetaceae bacterium]|nr:MAG: TetR/AcrR family transcriptional regulator [Spirochaetaceae bacterium]